MLFLSLSLSLFLYICIYIYIYIYHQTAEGHIKDKPEQDRQPFGNLLLSLFYVLFIFTVYVIYLPFFRRFMFYFCLFFFRRLTFWEFIAFVVLCFNYVYLLSGLARSGARDTRAPRIKHIIYIYIYTLYI